MSIQVSVFIATSIDGYIARLDHSLDWLERGTPLSVEESGYEAFFRSVDALVMGRKTFDVVLGFGAWPYGTTPTIVMSRNPEACSIPTELQDRVSTSALDAPALVERLAGEGKGRVYIDGGQVIQSFLRAGLVDDITITTIPVLIGEGLPLFSSLEGDIDLEHEKTTVLPNGAVQSTYRVSMGN